MRWTPHPVIVTIMDNEILLGSSYIPTILLLQGGGVLLRSKVRVYDLEFRVSSSTEHSRQS